MKATETKLVDFLKGPKQFIIPIYQRTYSWTIEECDQLWRDVVRSAQDDKVSGHFIGSIVYIEKGLYQVSSIPQLLVIDGQQRLTTMSLLLSALGKALGAKGLDGEARKLNNYFLFNAEEDGDSRYKLLLTQSDKPTLMRLLEDKELPEPHSRRIVENQRFFAEKIKDSKIDLNVLYRGVSKLIIVDISLNREHDNPQLIFESLNSTGLELSQADLIRNYVLMGLEPKEQTEIYNDYWFPMEQSFGQNDYVELFDRFMRDYLTVKTGTIPNIREVYAEFKNFARGASGKSIRGIVSDIYTYSKYFVRLALEKEEDKDIRTRIKDINTLKVDVAYPFFLEAYHAYANAKLPHADFLRVLDLVESYVFRRAVCGIPTNSLNKTFATIARDLDEEHFAESFEVELILKDSYRRFPKDDELERELLIKDLYNFRNRNYWLRKLENHGRKEVANVEDFTIEHIMPQNENVPDEWKAELGSDWKTVHDKYLHTIGNLTLTGYNTELSDKPFVEKRDMPGGFADSPIRLNSSLGKLDHWNEDAIITRAKSLAELAKKVWIFPRVTPECIQRRIDALNAEIHKTKAYTLDDHPNLSGGLLQLFEHIRKRILNLDASVKEEVLKVYIAYKTTTNFTDIEPKKNKLLIYLNVDPHELRDPKSLVRDMHGLNHHGNGNVELTVTSLDQLDDVMALIQQSFNKHADNGE